MSDNNDCTCPFCDQQFTPENGTTPEEHLAKGILRMFAEMEYFPHMQELLCPRCGEMKMRSKPATNARSRHFEIYICSECGTDEALRDYNKNVLPLLEWDAVKRILNLPGMKCGKYIPQKDSAYPLCDNRDCDKSAECNISAHMEHDDGY